MPPFPALPRATQAPAPRSSSPAVVTAPLAPPLAYRQAPNAVRWSATATFNSGFDSGDSYDGNSYLDDSFRGSDVGVHVSQDTTPTNSLPTTPGTSLQQDTNALLLTWAASTRADAEATGPNDAEVIAGLQALTEATHAASWAASYDTLLRCLASYGVRAPHAELLRFFVAQQAGERIGHLVDAMLADKLAAGDATVVELLAKLKLCALDKQNLNQVRAALDPTRLTLYRTQTLYPVAAPPAHLDPRPAAPSVVHAVRKEPLHLGADQPEPFFCGPISVMRDVGAEAAVQGAALALMGRTFAIGSTAKIKPVVLLGGVVDDTRSEGTPPWRRYVVRVERGTGARDTCKENLRGPNFRRTSVLPVRQRLHERRALETARSEMTPHLRWVDGKHNAYQLLPYYDGDLCRAVQRNPQLGKNAALVRAIFDGVLPRLVRLHAKEQIHFDIKPDNLLVDAQQGRVVLADFGHAGPRRPERAIFRGTPRYHAPEMLADHGYGLTAAIDLYSLAVTVACIVDNYGFSQTPLYRLNPHELSLQRPELVAQAREQLRASGVHVDDASLAQRANLMALGEASAAYADWYEQRAPELLAASEAGQLRWPDEGFDGLILAVARVDLAAARLVARGLHAEPRVRGDAAAWADQLHLYGRAPSTAARVALRSQLLANRASDPRAQRAEAAFAELKRAAACGNFALAGEPTSP